MSSKENEIIVIKNDKGTNEIFHANKKNIKEFERLQKQVEVGSRDAHFLHPDLQSAWAGSKEHLLTATESIIPQDSTQSQTNKLKLNKRRHNDTARIERPAEFQIEEQNQSIKRRQRWDFYHYFSCA